MNDHLYVKHQPENVIVSQSLKSYGGQPFQLKSSDKQNKEIVCVITKLTATLRNFSQVTQTCNLDTTLPSQRTMSSLSVILAGGRDHESIVKQNPREVSCPL